MIPHSRNVPSPIPSASQRRRNSVHVIYYTCDKNFIFGPGPDIFPIFCRATGQQQEEGGRSSVEISKNGPKTERDRARSSFCAAPFFALSLQQDGMKLLNFITVARPKTCSKIVPGIEQVVLVVSPYRPWLGMLCFISRRIRQAVGLRWEAEGRDIDV